jgi:hypothetical protein
MPANIDFFSTYVLMAVTEEIVPQTGFFRDRYFPTAASDIFKSDKVLTEYRKGDRKMAAFVAPRVGDIPMERRGYEINEYTPPYIAPSRILTLDDLKKRGFGEALYPGMDAAQRAAQLQKDDIADMDARIARREEWMAVQTMLNNGCTMQEYIDDNTTGEQMVVQFYNGSSDHTYTVSNVWNGQSGDFFGDVKAMCKLLAKRGLPAADLILGTDTADAIQDIQKVRDLLDKNSGIITGEINAELTKYDGVAFMGVMNFGGFRLNLFDVSESYTDSSDQDTAYFPAKGAMVTAPGCGHMMYGSVTQIDFGSTEFATYAGKRIPKFILDQANDTRKLRLACRPLAAPKQYCPYIYAANAIS